MELEKLSDGRRVVSSVTVADFLDRAHWNVLQGIDALLEINARDGAPIDRKAIESGTHPHPVSGVAVRDYRMTERGALMYAERLRGPLRIRLVQEIKKSFEKGITK